MMYIPITKTLINTESKVNVANIKAVAARRRFNGRTIYLSSENGIFAFDADSEAPEDLRPPVQVIRPDIGSGRWIRVTSTGEEEGATIVEITEQIILQDDFHDVSGLWTEFQGKWSVADGKYIAKGNPGDLDDMAISVAGDEEWTDYFFEAMVRLIDVPGETEAGVAIFLRFVLAENTPPNTPLLMMRKSVAPGNVFIVVIPQEPQGVPLWLGSGMILGQWYRLRIEVRGEDYKFYIDNELKYEGNIPDVESHGRIALMVESENVDKYHAEFDDVRVGQMVGSIPTPSEEWVGRHILLKNLTSETYMEYYCRRVVGTYEWKEI